MSSSMTIPKQPSKEVLERYFVPSLLAAKAYAIATPDVDIKLDQNESPWDWPENLKSEILSKVLKHSWNRYPEAMGAKVQKALSDYVGVPEDCLLTSPGSNVLIPLILDAMGKHSSGKVVIARPTFGLFELHCQYAGISYELWPLNEDIEYDIDTLPNLPKGSLVIFASPNNPTGTVLSSQSFAELLKSNPDSMFLADEAYYEFNDEPYRELLAEYDNVMILRTMSKTMAAAGVRIGYLMGASSIIAELKKLRLPFMLNHFALEAAEAVLSDPRMRAFVDQNITNAKQERSRLAEGLSSIKGHGDSFRVIPSKANFLLLQWRDQNACNQFYQELIRHRILVRNVSGGPGLSGCLRVSIGKDNENTKFLEAFRIIASGT